MEEIKALQELANSTLLMSNNIWMMVSTFLVFIMHLGFATLESGMTQSKNTVNILFKNTVIPAIGLLTYAGWGFNLMYPGFAEGDAGIFAFAGWGIDPGADYDAFGYAGAGYTYWTDFLFQGMFAATAATIVSGAVAERIKLGPFLLFSVLFVGVVYPWLGSWKWGAGWLDAAGFYDFAGSTLVHSVGGWGALAGDLILGPRVGKFVDGKINPIPGHNLPLGVIGVFLLWLGWFGFNGGSVLSADPEAVSFVLVTTSLAAAAGAISGPLTMLIITKKYDLTMALNGILAGLVGITAGADQVSITSSIIIGLIAGVLCPLSVIFFDKMKIDDPVGAISVHLVCGIWGTLAVGIFGDTEYLGLTDSGAQIGALGTQALGILAYGAVAFPFCLIFFYIIKATVGLRVAKEEEVDGLDLAEHGMRAYNITR
ncbi:MAG: ammonium transporter [Cyclobacteriaceae bacterium]